MVDKEEKSKEELIAELSMKNLQGSMWNYAAPEFITPAEYGNLANSSQALYAQSISKSPEQYIYEQLFLPQLAKKGGAITSPYLQNTSAAILQESLLSIKIEDALKFMKYEGKTNPEYAGKYVNQLDEKVAGAIVGSAIQYKTDGLVQGILDLRMKGISKNLETIIGEPEKKE